MLIIAPIAVHRGIDAAAAESRIYLPVAHVGLTFWAIREVIRFHLDVSYVVALSGDLGHKQAQYKNCHI